MNKKKWFRLKRGSLASSDTLSGADQTGQYLNKMFFKMIKCVLNQSNLPFSTQFLLCS